MDFHDSSIELGAECRIYVEPCDCCRNTTLVIYTPTCLLRLDDIEPEELGLLAQAFIEAALTQAEKDVHPEWN
jgi:hypothetical protein